MKKPIPFGKYYLLERVNVGGMAEVFKAKAFGVEGFERLLAVKRILSNIAEDKEFIEMFIDEAKISVQLNHANIAQIFDLGKVEDSFFIALEFVHGKDLRAIFDRARQMAQIMPIAQACFIIMKVCEGLDYAHNKRDGSGGELHLVHRDVSPQNVLVSYEGEIKLIDFGIAKAAGKASKTQAGILKGKFGYMSPEQVRGLPIDRRSDIFSVGIVLYELLTAERLFVGESDFSTLEKVRNVEILPPSTYNRKIPEELERIALKALAKDVEDRYQNAIDLHDDLQAFMYTAGEFYSRKDLAGWMKKTFAAEIEDETRKLEEYANIPPPDPSALRAVAEPMHPGLRPPSRPPQLAPGPANRVGAAVVERLPTERGGRGADPGGRAALAAAPGRQADLDWDEEELETQIFDKEGAPPHGREVTGEVRVEESSLPRVRAPVPTPVSYRPIPPRTPTPHVAESGYSEPPPSYSSPSYSEGPPRSPTQYTSGQAFQPAPVFGARVARTPGGVLRYVAMVLGVALICAGVLFSYWYLHRTGTVTVTSFPSDVQVLVDSVPVAKETPFTLDKPPGQYKISVQREGYVTQEKDVIVRSGERTPIQLALVPLSAEVAFILKSEPPRLKAYLDGRELDGVTPFKVRDVVPGVHKVEIKPGKCYASWSQEFTVDASKPPVELNALLKPASVKALITSDPPHAKLFLSTEGSKRSFLGETPKELKLDPAKLYALSLERAGYKSRTEPIKFDGRCDLPLDVKLEKGGTPIADGKAERPPAREPPASDGSAVARSKEPRKSVGRDLPGATGDDDRAAGGLGYLTVGTRPWTYIAIDDKDTGMTTPQPRIVLPPGQHKLHLWNPESRIDVTVPFEIGSGQTKIIKKFQVEEKPPE